MNADADLYGRLLQPVRRALAAVCAVVCCVGAGCSPVWAAPGWFARLAPLAPPTPWAWPGEGAGATSGSTPDVAPGAVAECAPLTLAYGPLAPMDLAAAIARALCQQPALHATWAHIQIAQAQTGVAHAAYYPELALGASAAEETARRSMGAAASGTLAFDRSRFATLTWRLLDGGGRLARNSAAQAALAAALNSHDAALQKALLGVTSAYFEVQLEQARWTAAQQAVHLARQTQSTVARRSAHGVSAEADVLQARAATARAVLHSHRAAGALQRARVQLAQTLGLAAGSLPPLLPMQESTAPMPIEGPAAWASLAEFHPALRAAHDQLRSAEAKRAEVRSDGLPTLDLRQTHQWQSRSSSGPETSSNTTSISLNLRIPVFEGFANHHRLRGAAAQVALRTAERDALARDIRRQIHLAATDAESSLQAWHAAQQWVMVAQHASDAVQRRFASGVVEIVALLQAQSAVTEAREARFRALAEWHAAHLALLSSAGVLNRAGVALAQPVPAAPPGVE